MVGEDGEKRFSFQADVPGNSILWRSWASLRYAAKGNFVENEGPWWGLVPHGSIQSGLKATEVIKGHLQSCLPGVLKQ